MSSVAHDNLPALIDVLIGARDRMIDAGDGEGRRVCQQVLSGARQAHLTGEPYPVDDTVAPLVIRAVRDAFDVEQIAQLAQVHEELIRG